MSITMNRPATKSASVRQTKTKIGLVLQGGGALGAYEYGAVTQLVAEGFEPTIISGVSIGAINAAAVAGAKDGDIAGSLKELWSRITLPAKFYIPEQFAKMESMFGNPAFYANRRDWWAMKTWTSFCDTSPIRQTLREVVDFERLNDPALMRFCVTATNVASGGQVHFDNMHTEIGPEHIVASGSLPPSFPATEIDGEFYWDGGLFDNTPLKPVINMVATSETENLPIFVIDLVPTYDAIPRTIAEVKNRMMELSFENRFWDEFGGPKGLVEHADMLSQIDSVIPKDHPIRNSVFFGSLMRYRVLKHLKVVPASHQAMSDGMDFSAAGVEVRRLAGRSAVKRFLDSYGMD
jgi:NTE family protein